MCDSEKLSTALQKKKNNKSKKRKEATEQQSVETWDENETNRDLALGIFIIIFLKILPFSPLCDS